MSLSFFATRKMTGSFAFQQFLARNMYNLTYITSKLVSYIVNTKVLHLCVNICQM
jgi:hypothetical protein